MNESVLSKLSGRLAGSGQALCAWVTMNEPAVAETLAREAFDAVVLDMQHGAVDFDGAMRSILRVALAGKPTIARVPIGAFALASQLMDSGACGILAPMIDSGEDARRLVEFVKFPPLGQRSWGPRAALPLSGLDAPAYLKAANAMTQAIAMIETRAALDAIDDILSVRRLGWRVCRAVGSFNRLDERGKRRAAWRDGHERGAAGRRARQGAREICRNVLFRRRRRPGDAGARLSAVHHLQRPDAAALRGAERTRRCASRMSSRTAAATGKIALNANIL